MDKQVRSIIRKFNHKYYAFVPGSLLATIKAELWYVQLHTTYLGKDNYLVAQYNLI